MKTIAYFSALILALCVLSCKQKKTKPEQMTAKEIAEKFTTEQMDTLLALKTDSTTFISSNATLAEISQNVTLDTLLAAAKIIYLPDDRIDFYEEKDPNRQNNSKGVVALVRETDLTKESNNRFRLSTIPFKDAMGLCSNERFMDQPIASFCSGFAVGKNVIVTAGHCITSEDDLKTVRFIFDYKYTDPTTVKTVFEKPLVLSGKRIIDRGLSGGIDYAIIEVNETIPQDRQLKINTTVKIADKETVYVIGHPVGLPLKIAGGSFVRINTDPLFFTANLDTYGGNSGSPVFNARTNEVEGILVRGGVDFIKKDGCRISNACPSSGCNGEDVSRASQLKGKLP